MRDFTRSIHNLRPRAVVQGQREGRAGVLGRGLLRPVHRLLHFLGQLVRTPDVGHPDVVVLHALEVGDEIALEQLHQEADFSLRAAEVVLQGEGVEGEPGKVNTRRRFNHKLDAFSALLMT